MTCSDFAEMDLTYQLLHILIRLNRGHCQQQFLTIWANLKNANTQQTQLENKALPIFLFLFPLKL